MIFTMIRLLSDVDIAELMLYAIIFF